MHKTQGVHQQERGFSTSIFVEGPNGQTVLVLDPFKRNPMYKFPGGKSERVKEGEEEIETATACAVRELLGETGLPVKEEDLFLLKCEDRSTHDFYFFKVRVQDFAGLREIGDEGELIKIVPISKLLGMETFLHTHRTLLEEAMFERLVDIE